MTAYRQVDDCWLTACRPGSAPGPMLGNEYGKPLSFFVIVDVKASGQTYRDRVVDIMCSLLIQRDEPLSDMDADNDDDDEELKPRKFCGFTDGPTRG